MPDSRQSDWTACPDCGHEVIRVSDFNKLPYVERDPEGALVLSTDCWDNERNPTAMHRHKLKFDRAQEAPRYRFHECPRRVPVADDLHTIHRAYARRRKGPALHVPVSKAPDMLSVGDETTVYDRNGNRARAIVEDVQFVVRVKVGSIKKEKVRA